MLPRATPPAESLKRLLEFDPDAISVIHLRRDDLDVGVARDTSGWVGVARPPGAGRFSAQLAGANGNHATRSVTRNAG